MKSKCVIYVRILIDNVRNMSDLKKKYGRNLDQNEWESISIRFDAHMYLEFDFWFQCIVALFGQPIGNNIRVLPYYSIFEKAIIKDFKNAFRDKLRVRVRVKSEGLGSKRSTETKDSNSERDSDSDTDSATEPDTTERKRKLKVEPLELAQAMSHSISVRYETQNPPIQQNYCIF